MFCCLGGGGLLCCLGDRGVGRAWRRRRRRGGRLGPRRLRFARRWHGLVTGFLVSLLPGRTREKRGERGGGLTHRRSDHALLACIHFCDRARVYLNGYILYECLRGKNIYRSWRREGRGCVIHTERKTV